MQDTTFMLVSIIMSCMHATYARFICVRERVVRDAWPAWHRDLCEEVVAHNSLAYKPSFSPPHPGKQKHCRTTLSTRSDERWTHGYGWLVGWLAHPAYYYYDLRYHLRYQRARIPSHD